MNKKLPVLLSALILSACSVDSDDDTNSTSGSVFIEGVSEQGQILQANHDLSDEDGEITILAYQWQADGVNLDGENATSIQLTQANVGTAITVNVLYTDGVEGAQEFTSEATSAVANVDDAPTGGITLEGVLETNEMLTAVHNIVDIDGIDESSIVIEWTFGETVVANVDTYMAVAEDADIDFSVSITYTDLYGSSYTIQSETYQLAKKSAAYLCPENDAQMYFCDDFEDGTFDDKWDDLISTYELGSPGVFDVLDDGNSKSLRFTAGTRGDNKVDGELILTKADQFTNVPADFALEYKIRPRNNSNTGSKYLFAMLRYHSPLNWYLGGLNMQGSTASTQVEAGYASTADEIQRKLQVKSPVELGTKDEEDGTWYTIRIDAIGSTLTAYLNGEVLGSWTDEQALYNAAGLVGFYTYNRSFEVDYVKVFDPAVKPVQLTLDYADTSWITAADGDPLAITVSAITDDGSTADTYTAVSSDEAIVEVSIDGTTVTLTPKSAGDVEITFTSGSDPSVQSIIKTTIEPAWIMPTTDFGSITVVPALGATDQYIDETLSITFDETPTGLGTTGEVRIFNSSGELVDRIKASGESDEIGLSADDKTRILNRELLTLDGSMLIIKPHTGVLTYNETYTVTIGDNVVLGAKLNSIDFNGLGDNANWQFSTQAAGPDASSVSLTVDDDGDADFRTVQGALTWFMQNTAQETAVTVNLKNGTYDELLYLRNKDNLTILGESRDGVMISAENYDGVNGGSGKGVSPGESPAGGRSLFLVEGGDLLTLEKISITNTHTRTGSGDQAETIYFNSKAGRLIARDSNFVSEQDTLLMKGYNWFYNSKIAGNVDFIWGYSVATVFENSEIVTLGDSKVAAGGDTSSSGGYILQARVENENDPGFVFLNSELTSEAGPLGITVNDGTTYLARSGGDSSVFDNITFVNTKMGAHIADIGWAYKDINSQPAPTPVLANATAGWKEYNSMDSAGNALDLSNRCDANGSCYELTTDEYNAAFCSRAQIFAGFNSGEGWDPYPEDTSDDGCTTVTAETWAGQGLLLGEQSPEGVTKATGSIVAQSDTAVSFQSYRGKMLSASQSFYLVSQNVTGDFILTAKVKSMTGAPYSHNQFSIGLMMCDCSDGDTTPILAHLGLQNSGDDSTFVELYGHIQAEGGSWGKDSPQSLSLTPGDDLYLRLERRNTSAYYAFISTDGGATFTQIAANSFTGLSDTIKVGFYSVPYNDVTVEFEDITLTQ